MEYVMVSEFPDYEISKSGIIKKTWNGRGVSMSLDKNGYFKVFLFSGTRSFNRYVHRLVATAFIPNIDNKPYVNHKDADKLNNHVDNLEWCTHQENINHAKKLYLFNPRRGSFVKTSKLKEVDVLKIRVLLDAKVSPSIISRQFLVSRATIYKIKNNKVWTHVK